MDNVFKEFHGCFCVYQHQIHPFKSQLIDSVPAIPVCVCTSEYMANHFCDFYNSMNPGLFFVEPIGKFVAEIDPITLPFE